MFYSYNCLSNSASINMLVIVSLVSLNYLSVNYLIWVALLNSHWLFLLILFKLGSIAIPALSIVGFLIPNFYSVALT